MNSVDNTMKTVNTLGLVLGMLAISGIVAGGIFSMQAASAQPSNSATASNEDNDKVYQKNSVKITQKAKIKCDADASSANVGSVQVGSNTNTAANDCDSTQTTGTIGQANVNTDNDVQVASAEACQAIAGLIGANLCGNTF